LPVLSPAHFRFDKRPRQGLHSSAGTALQTRHNWDFQQEGIAMKKLTALILLAAAMGGLGCARPNEVGWTPVYTMHEREQIILRNWDYEGKQKDDDIDSALLLRPASHLTVWNVR
jgi:hypothetical protein